MSITITNLVDPNGEGTFDKLMVGVQKHLDTQWAKNRIKSSDAATVIVQTMQAAMQAATEFTLTQDKAENEAALIAAKILETQAKVQEIQASILLIHAQRDKILLEATKVASEIALNEARVLVAEKEACILTIKCSKEAAVIDADLLQKARTAELTLKQITSEIAKTGLISNQASKANSESALLAQKKYTEIKQKDVMDAQISLYAEQEKGFVHKAKHNAASLLSDSYSVQLSQGTFANLDTGLEREEMKAAVHSMLSDVGINTSGL